MKNLKNPSVPKSKIELSGQGLGVASPEVVRQRAQTLAEQDGRHKIHLGDWQEARREVTTSGESPAPELPSGEEEVIPWGERQDQMGHAAPTVLADDENEVDADLVEEGVDEADQSQRRAAKTSRMSELE